MTVVTIPPLSCPIPTALHPSVDELNREGLAWISRFVMFDNPAARARYSAMNPGHLVGYVMPHTPLGPRLQVAAGLIFWLLAFDDLECDEVDGQGTRDAHIIQLYALARVTEAPTVTSDPFLGSLADLRRRLTEHASPVQVARWSSAMQAYFMANAAAAVQRSQGTVAAVDTYVAQRIHSGAVKPALMLLDVANGYELPAHELETPMCGRSTRWCARSSVGTTTC